MPTHVKKLSNGFLQKLCNKFLQHLCNATLNKAIKLKPKFAEAHYARGLLQLVLQEWEEAKSDLIAAKNAGLDIVASFRRANNSIADFEQEIGITLPENIAAMLTENKN